MLFVAIVVDPRYKLKYVKFWFKQWYDKEKADELGLKVQDALNRLYKHYNRAIRSSCGAQVLVGLVRMVAMIILPFPPC